MKFKGEVVQLSVYGSDVKVTVGNVRAKSAAKWREYGPGLTLLVTQKQARPYQIGRLVEFDVTVKP